VDGVATVAELSAEEKKRILETLERDREFRYSLMGLLGYKEILDRITRLEERFTRLEERQEKLEERQGRLEESMARLNDAVARLAEEQRRMRITLSQTVRYIEEVSMTLEEEARSMIELRLEQHGLHIKLDALIRPYVELDIYGSNGHLTIIGETKTRLAPRHIRSFERKIKLIRKREPELVKGKLVKAIYALWAYPEAVKKCEAQGIWLNTPVKELTAFKSSGS